MKTGIITECYADTLMLKIITRGNPNLQHQRGCNMVSRTMQEKYFDALAIGIIDYDKKVPPYLSEFAEIETSGALKFYKHPTKSHYFITIFPAIERFMLETAAQSNINLSDYNLPSDLNGLKAVTKSETSIRNADLERFYKALVRNNANNFSKIAQWITNIENQFNHQ
jgi:hypothetical protein